MPAIAYKQKLAAGGAGIKHSARGKIRVSISAGPAEAKAVTETETAGLIETLDELDPRSAFKELTIYIRRLLSRRR